MTKTMQGAVDRATECVLRNIGDDNNVSIEQLCQWAVGAAIRYIRGQPEPDGEKQKILPPEGSGMARQGANVKPEVSDAERRQRALMMGYTGDICQDCGNLTMVRNGTCLKCDTCGSTSGCS